MSIFSSIAVSPSGSTLLNAMQVTTSAGTVLNEGITIVDSANPANVGSVLASGAILVEPGGVNTQSVTGTVTAQQTTATNLSMTAVQPTAANLNVTAAIAASQTITAAQATAANLNATVVQSGTWTDRIVGNAGATLDSTVGAGTAPANALAVSGLYNTTAPAPTNTQAAALQLDQAANLLEFPGIQFKTGAVWNNSTTINTLQYATGTTTQGQLAGAPATVVQIDSTGSIGAVTFQGTYDNVNWISIPTGQILNLATLGTSTNPLSFSTSNTPLLFYLNGFSAIRLNLTTIITGGGTVTPYWAVLPYAPPNVTTSGILKTSITGNASAVLDATISPSAGPTNGIATLAQYQGSPPAPTSTQTVMLQCDSGGSLFVHPFRRKQTITQVTTIASSSSATTVVTAQAANVFSDITMLIITPTGTGTNTAFTATLSDGTVSYIFDMNTGGTTSFMQGSILVLPFNPPLIATTAATAWTIALSSASVTVHISVVAIITKAA